VVARVAVNITDPDLSRDLVSKLRSEGYLVVEPEVADLNVKQRQGVEGVHLDAVSHFGGRRLPQPVSVYQFIATMKRLLPALPQTYSIESDGQGGYRVHVIAPSNLESGRVVICFPTYEQAREWIIEKIGEAPTSGEPPRDYPGRNQG
jgi:hypothetical protein